MKARVSRRTTEAQSFSKSALTSLATAAVVLLAACDSVLASSATIVVQANPLWTDTGLALAPTDVVQIYGATGAWKSQINVPFSDADGSMYCQYVWDEWISDGHHGQLIGFVGTDPNDTNAVSQNSPALFVVGTNSVTFAGKTGELWLGFNDAFATRYPGGIGVNDNSGSVTVQVARATVQQSLSIGVGGPDILLSMPTVAGNLYSYCLQATTDLVSGAWTTLGSNLISAGSVMTNFDTAAPAFSQRFYRMAIRAAPPQAADTAADSAYDCGWIMSAAVWNGFLWTDGITGGTGFGPWQLTATGVIGGPSNGFFVGTSTTNAAGGEPGIDVGGRSWGMYANSNNFATAYRAFANGPLQVGQMFLIDMDNGFIDTNSSVGLVMRTGTASSSPSDYEAGARFEFQFLGGDSSNSYKVVDAGGLQNIGVPFTGTGLHLVFMLNTTNTYTLLAIDNASNVTNTFAGTLGGATDGSLDSVALFNFNAGKGPDHACFFNSMAVSNPIPIDYTVGTTTVPAAGGSAGGGGTVAAGSNVTVCATASSCYSFVGWIDESNTVVSTAPCYTFTVQTNRNLMANFGLTTYTINTSAAPPDGGSTSGGGTVACGSNVTVCATASPCFGFVSWSDESSNVVSTEACFSFTASASRALVANFAPLASYTINTSSLPPDGGSTSGGGAVACGSNVTVCATANPCYGFVNWTDDSSNVVSTAACYSFAASTNLNLVANFTLLTNTITTSASPAEGGSTSGGGSVACGSNVTVCATNNAGYSFVNWTDDGSNVVSTTACYSFTASTDTNLVANFAAAPTQSASSLRW